MLDFILHYWQSLLILFVIVFVVLLVPMGLVGFFVLEWLGMRRATRRMKRGQCIKCGCDVRYSTERGPECGFLL